MKQNRIHIDDLVRQRLRGADEPGPPAGAWRAMREKLDAGLPAGTRPVGGGVGWGRAARWTTAVLLLACLGTGGYQVAERGWRGASGGTGELASTGSASNTRTPGSAARLRENTAAKDVAPGAQPGSQPTAMAASANPRKAHAAAPPAVAGPMPRTGSIPTSGLATASAASKTTSHAQQGSRSATGAAVQDAPTRRPANTPARSRTASDKNHAATRPSTAQTAPVLASNTSVARNRRNRQRSGTAPSNATSVTRSAATEGTASRVSPPRPSTAPAADRPVQGARRSGRARDTRTASASAAPQPVPQSTAPARSSSSRRTTSPRRNAAPATERTLPRPAVRRDTIAQIRVAQYARYNPATRTVRYITDTTQIGTLVIEQPLAEPVGLPSVEPIAKAPSARAQRRAERAAQKAEALAAAKAREAAVASAPPATNSPATAPAPPTASASAATAAPAAGAQAAAKSGGGSEVMFAVRDRLFDFARRTREGLSLLRFYTGTTAGLNTAVAGGTPQLGFQLGLTGLLAFNEQWALGLEGKYFQRFNRGASLEDSYDSVKVKVEQTFMQNGQEYSVYSYRGDSFNHYFNVPALGSIEAPLYVRYTRGKIHGLVGANFSYSLRANVEEVNRKYNRSGWDTTTTAYLQSYYSTPSAPTVRHTDFGPRFGIGYVAGVGYQVTPALGVDVRAVQQLWDNKSAAAGGKKVWETFYDAPSVQVSVGYRFGAGRKRPGVPASEGQ